LTVNVNPGSPAFALFGESCMMTGTVPAVGMGALGALYPPHPSHSSVSNNTEIIFITHTSSLVTSSGDDPAKTLPECRNHVIFL
jgi:hypothetical protein